MGGDSGPTLAIVGPTAVGKSALALALADSAPIEIVSADSRQIYRGLDIGTAKPSADQRARVPHHGIDLVGPAERYSAGRFARDAAGWIADIVARGRRPVVVGGTGLYLRALFDGLFAEPELDAARRNALRQALGTRDAGELAHWAHRLDPGFRGGGGRHRAIRAIEVALLTGRPLSAWQLGPVPLAPSDPFAPRAPIAPFYLLLTLPRAVLHARIRERVEAMLAAGLVDEVRGLLAAGVPPDAPGLTGVGYRECVAHLRGELAGADLAEAIAAATRRYAKRQETWFRHQLKGHVLVRAADREPSELAREVWAAYTAAAG